MSLKSKFELTEDTRRQLEALLLAAERRNDLRTRRRVRGLLLVGRDGLTRVEAARICDVDESCLYDWQQRFQSGGIEGIETKKAPGPERRLTAEELGRLAALIQSGPEAAGFDTGVWTTRQVKKMIKREFGQSYCTSQICRILHKLGFSFQLPKTRLARADAEAQRECREERMLSIVERAETEKGGNFFCDESVFQQSGTKTRTWARVGQGVEVKSEPCRRSMKAFGAVSREHKPRFHFQFSERFSAHTFLKFLSRLVRHEARKVLLVLDNVGYHHARRVTDWAEANADKIELHFLPAYSPDLNPIEIL